MAEEGQLYTVRRGSGGEFMIVSPDGECRFVGFWGLLRFIWTAARADRRVEFVE